MSRKVAGKGENFEDVICVNDPKTQVNVVSQYLEVQDERGRVFRTSPLVSGAALEEKVAQSFNLNHLLSGAGSCRYCLDKCPEGT